MRYCLIHNLYPPYAIGGAERVVQQVAERLARDGHHVVVITSRPWGGWGSWRPVRTEENGIPVWRFWAPNICWYGHLARRNFVFKTLWHKINMWNLWSTKIVQKILKEEAPDAVWTHNLIGIGFGIPKMIQKNGYNHIHTVHDVQLVEPSGILPWDHAKDTLVQRVYQNIVKRKMRSPHEVIAPSQFLKEFYTRRGFFKESHWRVEAATVVPSVPLKEKKGQFLFVGSLAAHKGIRVLMEAWDLFLEKHNGVHHTAGATRLGTAAKSPILHIAGDGVLRKEVEAWARGRKNVMVHGRKEGDALEQIYAACDTLIFPSVCMENRPTVIVEALERGLFVVASDTGGAGELVPEGRGVLVRPGNAKVLEKAIQNTLQ